MPKIFLEDKNTTVEFPDGMSSREMERHVRDTFYTAREKETMPTQDVRVISKSLPGLFIDTAGAFFTGVKKEIQSLPANLADIAVSQIAELAPAGNEFSQMADKALERVSVPRKVSFEQENLQKRLKMKDWLNQKSQENKAFIAATYPAQATRSARFMEHLGSGAVSLGESLGVTFLTKSPSAAGVFFGLQAKGRGYVDALEAGKPDEEARKISSALGIVEGGLEFWGIHRFITSQGTLVKRALKGMVTEFIQEFSQEGAEQSIRSFTGIRDFKGLQSVVDIILESLYSGAIGFVLGGPGSAVIAISQRKDVSNTLQQEMSIEKKQADVLANQIMDRGVDQVFEGVKVAQEEIETGTEKIDIAEEQVAEATPFPEELTGLVEEARQFDTVEEFVANTEVSISLADVQDLGFNDSAVMMDSIFQESRRIVEEERLIAEEAAIVEALTGLPETFASTEQAEEFGLANIDNPAVLKALQRKREELQIEARKLNRKDASFEELKEGLDLSVQAQFMREAIEAAEGTIRTGQLDKLKKGILGQVEGITLKEIPLSQRIIDIKKKFQRKATIARKEVQIVQEELITELELSGLEAKDKAKFIKAIKNVQTAQQLARVFPKIENRIERLIRSTKKNQVSKLITKELKTTKPFKVGQKRVAKFDFETNKLFDSLRDFNKLTQEKAQAEFDKFPEEVTSEVDLIKKRFLSLKANGANASLEIHDRVQKDILRIKELGKQAKNEADLEKKLNRQEIIEDALASISQIKADKRTVKTKIGNVYRKGFTSSYSMLNSIGGKVFAETHDPELSENKRNTAIYKSTLDLTVAASKVYNEKNIMRLFETMSLKDYQITDIKDNLTIEISKLEIIDVYNSLKNEKKKQDYFEAFGEGQVQSLITNLTDNDKLFGDMLQESVQGYREILNTRNIEITGRDLGFIENYWPATSEFRVSVLDDLKVQGETPSALKERAKTKVIPVPKNAWYKAQRHIAQAEHVKHLSREFEKLKRLFSDRRVKHAITQKFGNDVYRTLLTQVDNISLNKQTERVDAISGIFQRAINNWVTAKIALNPSTYVRQLMSVGNYAEQMSGIEWTNGFFKGITSPRKTFEFMWKNAPFLEARFNKGFSEALTEAIEGAESISVNQANWTKFLTALVRSGDVTAIIYGGFPLVQAEMKKGKSIQEAFDTFEKATLKAQQSGLSTSVSQFQNSRNPFTRLFLAFKNTSNQYFRKMVDAVISFQNGDISVGQFAKTMSIYAAIQPILYVSAGFLTKTAFSFLGRIARLREDDEDFEELLEKFLNDMMVQLIVSPVNAIPIIDDIARTAARKVTGQKAYKVFSTPLFDDLETGVRSLAKNEVEGKDYLNATAAILEPATKLPLKTGIRYYEILTGQKVGGKPKKKF